MSSSLLFIHSLTDSANECQCMCPCWASLVAQMIKNAPEVEGMQKMRVRPLGWEDRLEKRRATHSSALTWGTPWTEGATVHGVAKSQTTEQLTLSLPPRVHVGLQGYTSGWITTPMLGVWECSVMGDCIPCYRKEAGLRKKSERQPSPCLVEWQLSRG